MLEYTEHAPHPRLTAWIDTYWSLEGRSNGIAEPVIPDGRGELVLNFSAGFHHVSGETAHAQPRLIIAGQVTAPFWLIPGRDVDLFGIRFTPAGQSALFREPASLLRDRWVDALDVCADAGYLCSAMFDSCDRPAVVDQWVLNRATGSTIDTVSTVASRIFDEAPGCSVASVAARIGLSTRTLERRFAEHVGVSPKEYQRIRRLNRAASLVLYGGATWSRAAHSSGYTDQAHLNREFREMTGTTPTLAVEPPAVVTRLLVSQP